MGAVQQFPVQGTPTTAPAATLAGVLRRASIRRWVPRPLRRARGGRLGAGE